MNLVTIHVRTFEKPSELLILNSKKGRRVGFSSPAFFGAWRIFHQWREVFGDDARVDKLW